jgi:hypothetical protein
MQGFERIALVHSTRNRLTISADKTTIFFVANDTKKSRGLFKKIYSLNAFSGFIERIKAFSNYLKCRFTPRL